MFGNEHSARWAQAARPSQPSVSRFDDEAETLDEAAGGVFAKFDGFLDRMPAWPFHSFAGITAMAALWFAMAALGGLPRGIVEWIAMGMFGIFAYAVGFMIPLLLAYIVEASSRLSMLLALAGGALVCGAIAFQGPV